MMSILAIVVVLLAWWTLKDWVSWVLDAFREPVMVLDPRRINEEVRIERRQVTMGEAGTGEWRACAARVAKRMKMGAAANLPPMYNRDEWHRERRRLRRARVGRGGP
jgi:hypothetical protein